MYRIMRFVVFCFIVAVTMILPLGAFAATDPDFSIIVFPDTQYYSGSSISIFQDQVNWVVANQAALNIKMVIGVGDIIDAGGYPIDSYGNTVGTCAVPPPSSWQKQWQDAKTTIKILTDHGIYYQPTIGNHDYDCQGNRPQSRSATNYLHYFASPTVNPTAYILDSQGNKTPNFYKTMTIGSTTYMILSLEFYPQSFAIAAANKLISNFSGPVIVVTHAYLSNDGSGPTFASTAPAGSAYPLCSGFPGSIYSCLLESYATYKPAGGTDGIGLWHSLIGIHQNIFMALSGHIRNPGPGDYPNVPPNNGVGHVDCSIQSWTTLCSNPYRPLQMVADYQGQGHGGFFGYGYLRILTVSPSQKKVSVFTYSPSIALHPANFSSGMPAYKTDHYNQFALSFPNTFGGPDSEITYIKNPPDGGHVPLTFGISAAAYGPHKANHIQIYLDNVKYRDYTNMSALPTGTTVTLPQPGIHRIAVQSFDTTNATWVKSVVYVTNP
jgi:hypothetical protein